MAAGGRLAFTLGGGLAAGGGLDGVLGGGLATGRGGGDGLLPWSKTVIHVSTWLWETLQV